MLCLMQDGKLGLPLNIAPDSWAWFLFNFCNIDVWTDVDFFVPCAAGVTATDAVSLSFFNRPTRLLLFLDLSV